VGLIHEAPENGNLHEDGSRKAVIGAEEDVLACERGWYSSSHALILVGDRCW